jgi:hypothetical protein
VAAVSWPGPGALPIWSLGSRTDDAPDAYRCGWTSIVVAMFRPSRT